MASRVTFIGAGNMGLALMRGLLDSGVSPDRIAVTNKRLARSKETAEQYGVRPMEKNAEAVRGADIVITYFAKDAVRALERGVGAS